MPEPLQHNPWLLRYIVTAETAAICMMLGFWATDYQDVVKHEDLAQIRFPYPADKPRIDRHMKISEEALGRITDSLHSLNERIIKENHATDLRITLLERKIPKR